ALDPLLAKGPVIDSRGLVSVMQSLVGDCRPALAHVNQLVDGGAQSQLAPGSVTELERGFRGQPLGSDFPRGCEQVSVKIARIASRIVARSVYRDIDGESIEIRELLCESSNQEQTLIRVELHRQRDRILPCHARVLALLGGLSSIPKGCPIPR